MSSTATIDKAIHFMQASKDSSTRKLTGIGCGWYIAYPKGSPNKVSRAACHAGVARGGRTNSLWMVTSLWCGQAKKTSDSSCDASTAFWDWCLGKNSPWKDVVPHGEIYYDKHRRPMAWHLKKCDLPAKQTYNLLIATRMPYEQPNSIAFWYDLVQMGVEPGDAYLLARIMHYQDHKTPCGRKVLVNQEQRGHTFVNPHVVGSSFKSNSLDKHAGFKFNEGFSQVIPSCEIWQDPTCQTPRLLCSEFRVKKDSVYNGMFKQAYNDWLRYSVNGGLATYKRDDVIDIYKERLNAA